MKLYLQVLFFIIFSCKAPKTTPNIGDTTISNTIFVSDSFKLADNKLIDSLYKDVILFKSTLVDSFECSHKYDQSKKIIEVNCTGIVNGHNFGYLLLLSDTALIYNKDLFEPSEEYKYKGSMLFLDGNKIEITGLKYLNEKNVIDPVNVWYGKDFGVAAKYYMLDDREVYLIRGINYYCNGSNCMNYKILLIQKFKSSNSTFVNAINLPGNYPYSFENFFLFRLKNDPIPKLYIVNEGKSGIRLSDYKIVNL